MRPAKLSDEEIATALQGLSGWSLAEGALAKRFVFKDFSEAFGWMARVALAAERLDHHPDWTNVYRTVEVRLSTHDAGGVTTLDFELAKSMDALAE
jgi:4a-hydroxytetrahydrobiopterin dehydratase